MAQPDPQPRIIDSGALRFAVAAVGSTVAVWLGRRGGLRVYEPGGTPLLMLLASLALLVAAGLAAWQLFRRREDPWLLPLAAVNLLLLEPGRAGDVVTWRLEWGVLLLPPLRALWVVVALLLLWWVGWIATARRYR